MPECCSSVSRSIHAAPLKEKANCAVLTACSETALRNVAPEPTEPRSDAEPVQARKARSFQHCAGSEHLGVLPARGLDAALLVSREVRERSSLRANRCRDPSCLSLADDRTRCSVHLSLRGFRRD